MMSSEYELEFIPPRMNVSYVRTRHKNIRCFPQCAGVHNERSFCGDSLIIIVKGDHSLENLRVFGEFHPVEAPSMLHPGDDLLPNREHQFIEATLVMHMPLQGTRFSFNPPRKWEYRAKSKPGDLHVFTVYALVDTTVKALSNTDSFQLIPIWKNAKGGNHGDDEDADDEIVATPPPAPAISTVGGAAGRPSAISLSRPTTASDDAGKQAPVSPLLQRPPVVGNSLPSFMGMAAPVRGFNGTGPIVGQHRMLSQPQLRPAFHGHSAMVAQQSQPMAFKPHQQMPNHPRPVPPPSSTAVYPTAMAFASMPQPTSQPAGSFLAFQQPGAGTAYMLAPMATNPASYMGPFTPFALAGPAPSASVAPTAAYMVPQQAQFMTLSGGPAASAALYGMAGAPTFVPMYPQHSHSLAPNAPMFVQQTLVPQNHQVPSSHMTKDEEKQKEAFIQSMLSLGTLGSAGSNKASSRTGGDEDDPRKKSRAASSASTSPS